MINLLGFSRGGGGTTELKPVLFLFSGTVFFGAMEKERIGEFGFEEPVFGEGEANDGSLKNEAQACVFIGLQKLGPSLRRRWLRCDKGMEF